MNILLGLLTRTLKMSEDEIKSLIYEEDSEELKEGALDTLLEKYADRIAKIKDKAKGEKEDQYKRGQRETSERWENDIRERFNLSKDLEGEELIAAAVDTKVEKSGGELDEDAVKKHPLFIKLQNERKKEIDENNAQWEEKLQNVEAEHNQKSTLSTIRQKAIALVRSKNPLLPDVEEKAQKRLRSIFPELEKYKFRVDGDDIIVLNEEGHQLTDDMEHPVAFNDLVSTISEDYFDFKELDDSGGKKKGGTDNKNDFGKGKFGKIKIPTNPEDLQKALDNAKDSDERTAISNAYLEAQK